MDRFDAMAVFVAVAEAGSLSAGARRLAMPLPTVSRKLAELEARLHSQLLVRAARGLALTEAGSAYLEASRRILEQVGEAERAAAGEYAVPKGRLAVTAPVVFGRIMLLPVVAQFLRAYPDIDVRLLLRDRNLNLLDEHVDAALRIGELPDSSTVATKLGSVRKVIVASPGHLAAHGTPHAPVDLSRHPSIAFSGEAPVDHWSFVCGKQQLTVALRPRLQVNTVEAAIDAAIAGVGVTRLLSYQVAAACAAGSLVRVLADFEPPALPVNFIFVRQGPLPLKLRAFLDFITPLLRARLETL